MSSVATKTVEFREQWEVDSLAFSPDGMRLAVSSPNTDEVHVWQWLGEPHVVQTLNQIKGGSWNSLRYSPDGTRLASAHHASGEDYKIVRVWNTATGEVAGDISERFGGSGALEYAALEFSADSRLLVRSQRGWHMEGDQQVFVDSLVVHDTLSWQRLWGLRTAPLAPTALALSPDGHFAALAGGERVERGGIPHIQQKLLVVDLEQRQVRQSFNVLADDCIVPFVVWSPDGQRIAVGGRAIVRGSRLTGAAVEIFAASGKQLGEYTHGSHVMALNYSPDGKYLLIGWDDVLEIWDAGHTKRLQQIRQDVAAANLSPDGRYLAISSAEHKVGIWALK